MRPMGRYLRNRFAAVTVWDHPHWLDRVDVNVAAMGEFLSTVPRELRLAIVTHSFGDWIVRRWMCDGGAPRLSALVSLAPVLTTNFASRMVGHLTGDRIDEIAIMRNPARAEANRCIAPTVRHLAVWPRVETWIRRQTYRGGHTMETAVWGTHNSIVMQPGVMRTVEKFLKCQIDEVQPAAVGRLSPRYQSVAAPVAPRSVPMRSVPMRSVPTRTMPPRPITRCNEELRTLV